ncbi:MAG: hypothetical protein WDZ35_01655 [Crocinitomicaceae bacterium]
MNDLVQLPKASVEKVDQDVLLTFFKPNTKILERDAAEIDGAHLSISQGGDMFVMVDMTAGGARMHPSAEDYFEIKGKMVPYIKAVAVVKEPKKSILFKLFKRPNRLIFPKKEFSSREAAQAWFDSLRN